MDVVSGKYKSRFIFVATRLTCLFWRNSHCHGHIFDAHGHQILLTSTFQRNIGRGGFAQRIQPRQSRVQILKSAGMKIGNGDLALVYDDQRGRTAANHPHLSLKRVNPLER